MRHLKKGRKFKRERDQRRALLRSLIFSLIKYEKIKTTEAKAKEIRPIVEKLITKAKKGGLSNYRLLISKINIQAAKKLVKEIGPRYKERKGGYTKIIKLPKRKTDGSKMAIIKFV